MTLRLIIYAFPLALVLSVRAFRKGSLDRSGAICAVATGTIAMTSSVRFGITLIVFFLGCSKVTRIGSKRKAEIEGGEYAGPGGNRSWLQVLSNAGTATVLALAFTIMRARDAREGVGAWAEGATEQRITLEGPARWGSLVQVAYLCHYACCNADTWASELGVLATRPPRLLTTLKRVHPGTNGGVSTLGLAASVAGGALIGVAYWGAGVLLLPAASSAGGAGAGHEGAPASAERLVLVLGPVAGLFGSLVDSLLGAVFQFSGYCSRRRCVVDRPGPTVAPISGVPLLSNNGVNFVSSLATAVTGAALVVACVPAAQASG